MIGSLLAMKKILIIKHGALGDVVISIGSIRAIASMYPDAEFHMMTMPAFVGIAKQTGVFTDYILDSRVSYWRLRDSYKVFRAMMAGQYDIIFDLQCTQRTSFYRSIWRRFSSEGKRQWVDTVQKCVYQFVKDSPLGVRSEKVEPFILDAPVTDLRFLKGEGKHFDLLPEQYVLLIPGCSAQHAYKRWPVAHYRAIVERLAAKNIRCVLMGTRDEAAELNAIAEGNPSVVNMMGKTSLLDVPQVALRALAVLGNDTGPSHMASFTGVYTLGLFESRNAKSILSGPHSKSIVSPGAMEAISIDEVWEQLEAQLPS